MKIDELEWFCPQPFDNISASGSSKKPCCLSEEIYKSKTIKDYHESEYLKNLKKEFLTKPGPLIKKTCVKCIHEENVGIKSQRKMYIEKLSLNRKKIIEEYLERDITFDDYIYSYLEHTAENNYCNLRCNMCNQDSSSSHANETLKINDLKLPHHDRTFSRNRKWPHYSIPKINMKEDYGHILENIETLRIVGGETLAIKEYYDLLELAIDMGVSKNIDLIVVTNCTLFPKFNGKTIFDLVTEFKSVKFTVSVEFWGERNNYIRFPSKWKKTLSNIENLLSIKNVKILIACTTNALNAGYNVESLIKYLEYKYKKSFEYNFIRGFATGSLVYGERQYYGLDTIPIPLKEMYIEKMYNQLIPAYKKFGKYAWNINQVSINTINLLENTEYNENAMNTMLYDIKARDKYRGTCLIDLFPEWKPYYENIRS